MHANQLTVTVDIVRDLVYDQFPDWSHLQIVPFPSEGTVNHLFRMGDGLVARFTMQPDDVDAVRERLHAEAAAARELAAHTSLAVPEPAAIGEPGNGYPLPWSVQSWIPGETASHVDPSASIDFGHDLARFILEVREIDVSGRTFSGTGRGGDLRAHDRWMTACFEQSDAIVDVPRLRRMWERLRELPRVSPDVMTHGDLTPGNVIVTHERLTGILDVGGLGAADPALDLVGAWHLLDPGPRQALRDDLDCDELQWERGKAWALQQAMGVVWYYAETNPAMSRMGRTTLGRLIADDLHAR